MPELPECRRPVVWLIADRWCHRGWEEVEPFEKRSDTLDPSEIASIPREEPRDGDRVPLPIVDDVIVERPLGGQVGGVGLDRWTGRCAAVLSEVDPRIEWDSDRPFEPASQQTGNVLESPGRSSPQEPVFDSLRLTTWPAIVTRSRAKKSCRRNSPDNGSVASLSVTCATALYTISQVARRAVSESGVSSPRSHPAIRSPGTSLAPPRRTASWNARESCRAPVSRPTAWRQAGLLLQVLGGSRIVVTRC